MAYETVIQLKKRTQPKKVIKLKSSQSSDSIQENSSKLPAFKRFAHLSEPVSSLKPQSIEPETSTETQSAVSSKDLDLTQTDLTVPAGLVLPHHLQVLLELFRSCDTVVSMLHNRKELCSFDKIQPAVQEITRRYGMCFAPSRCKVLRQDWQDSNPVLTLDGEQIEVVEKFVYLGSCISAGGGVSDEINARIVKVRLAYANLGHFWRLRDVSLAVKGRIYNASVRAVLLYVCETWPLRVEDVRRLSLFDHRSLRRIADILWQHHVGNAEVRHRVFGHRDDNPIGVNILKHRLRWLGHVLRMWFQRISRRELFADAGTGWKERRGG
ncbi:unnamed protein product [Schistosoma margrebowiei]|uniref:Uncharacterized protein n=1 Tax=Schistosoma margrebowiei TaxID=48269 RepID=A0A183MU48_9TREM|nr:unnamed protein product [Schistosoma margrebowiei]